MVHKVNFVLLDFFTKISFFTANLLSKEEQSVLENELKYVSKHTTEEVGDICRWWFVQ